MSLFEGALEIERDLAVQMREQYGVAQCDQNGATCRDWLREYDLDLDDPLVAKTIVVVCHLYARARPHGCEGQRNVIGGLGLAAASALLEKERT